MEDHLWLRQSSFFVDDWVDEEVVDFEGVAEVDQEVEGMLEQHLRHPLHLSKRVSLER